MSKHKSIRKMIERVIESCGGTDMREVRSRLEEAVRASRRAESREKEGRTAPSQQWAFDIATSSIRNLTRRQMEDALVGIERMIGEEKKSMEKKGPDSVITG